MSNALKITLAVLVLFLIFMAAQMKAIFVSFVLAGTLSAAIAPLAERAEKHKIPRFITVAFVFLSVGTIYLLAAGLLYPTLKDQAHNLYENLPEYGRTLHENYSNLKELAGERASALEIGSEEIRKIVSQSVHHAMDFTSNIFNCLISAILVIFLTGYFVSNANRLWKEGLEWIPPAYRQRVAGLIKPLESRLGGYVRGQLMVCLAVGSILGCGLFLIGVKYSLILGIIAGLLNLVPFVGSISATLLALLVASNQSSTHFVLTILLFFFEQWLESNFITPQLLGSAVELDPLVVLFAILIGGSLMGLPGALIAVPIATILMILSEEFYLKPMNNPLNVQPDTPTEANGDA
ncbi:AI-2E family transporter [bacterium]|nr:AI-2E family transporter [bacterium]QQR56610.1 MAG: AI-2E family transporter [Candidatus Melainabacteria bacterium]